MTNVGQVTWVCGDLICKVGISLPTRHTSRLARPALRRQLVALYSLHAANP